MKQSSLSSQESTADKKEYKVPLISAEELEFEMKHMSKGEAKPLVNINEQADTLLIEVAAPGLKNSDFNVNINDCVLTITCLHKETGYDKKAYRQQEFDYHCFVKEIKLPKHIDTQFISAEYLGGILRVFVPKSSKPFVHRNDWIAIY